VKLAIFDDYRLGVVSPDEARITDVSAALPWPRDSDPFGASWWVRLCRDFGELRSRIESTASSGPGRPLESVRLRAPVLNPSKIVACAANYAAHVAEMKGVRQRVGGPGEARFSQFDVFLKAPSSIIGPRESVVLPPGPSSAGVEIHHESELALVIGRGGSSIAEDRALDHVLGYTIGLDITVRGAGDRSRRKSYDTFTPLGPWVTTADEVGDPHTLDIRLSIGGAVRQSVNTQDLGVKIPGIIAYTSGVMRLEPGDVILTGAPQGVGPIRDADVMDTEISRLGRMLVSVRGMRNEG